MTKQYASPEQYETKLEKVMARLGVESYDYDWNRHDCWVSFTYKGQPYRFTHSVKNAKEHNIDLRYGSDAFAQVVLSLEDLARMVERGIYDLSTWVAGMKYLPAAETVRNILADPDGVLRDTTGLEYNYLYWEAKQNNDYDFSEGFVVLFKQKRR